MPRRTEKITHSAVQSRFKVGDTGELRSGGAYEVLALTELRTVKYVVCKCVHDGGQEMVKNFVVSDRELLDPIRNAVLYVNAWKYAGDYDTTTHDSAEEARECAREEWGSYREDNNWTPIAIAFRVTIPDRGAVPIPEEE